MTKLPQITKIFENVLVAADYIVEGTLIGVAYVVHKDQFNIPMLIATPLGGALQNDLKPNCILQQGPEYWALWAISDIAINQEITLNFSQYGL